MIIYYTHGLANQNCGKFKARENKTPEKKSHMKHHVKV